MTNSKKTRRAGNFGEEQRDGSKAEGGTTPTLDASIIARKMGLDLWRVEAALGGGYTPDRIERAAEELREARVWIVTNADAWRFIVRSARADALAGRRVSIARYVEDARALNFLDSRGEYSTYDNTHNPIFARFIVSEVPEAAPLIETRASVYDYLVGGEE